MNLSKLVANLTGEGLTMARSEQQVNLERRHIMDSSDMNECSIKYDLWVRFVTLSVMNEGYRG